MKSSQSISTELRGSGEEGGCGDETGSQHCLYAQLRLGASASCVS